MNERLASFKTKTTEFWSSRTKNQKSLLAGSVALVIVLIAAFTWFGSQTNYVPLYTNMSMQETGEVKATLDARGVANEVSPDGTSISVPESAVDNLKVQLAAEGIPQTGRIDYSTFGNNMGFGTTDNEFQLLERAAIQTSIEDLIRNIDGVANAQVMITMPEESVWLADEPDQATASVLLNMQSGYSLDQQQTNALYHLVAQSVPSLPVENIVIMDQFSRYLELENQPSMDSSSLTAYEQQRTIQKDIEREIQRDLHQMLGTMVGQDKVLVSVSTDIDFTRENRVEELVEPVDEETNEGIAMSVERITETYSGEEVAEGGVPGTGEDDIPNFPGVLASGGDGDYERIEERINNEVNRISRDIVESPYQIRDIGIQVMVEPPDPEDPGTLPPERLADISTVVGQVVRTSINSEISGEWGEEELGERIFVSSQPFIGKIELEEPPSGIPFWYYIVGALALIIGLLIFLLVRKGRTVEEEVAMEEQREQFELPPLDDGADSEEKARRRQLEQLAREKPDQFSQLIRTWLSED
ncbi:flagellar M-ring protein FliF [Paenalkalicoccus suaedae]|uniref:Flagellar M-ring protein n=1 Tax=Paenalkalicoccus suaedae TaxID=2592382 RepID=A0A859FER6_9BACI|nr:flagellar basal-body MS-ring/collar protein FliF [Paenalkalicoccus suaedae]QKS71441.1 flagellar M-ring protein FliF [Paenalkalicoccus suaedae]